jgi:uncharacterized protein
MTTLQIEQADRDCYFKVKVVPASSKTVVVGVLDGMLKLRVTAVPEKGKANKSIIAFLAKKLGVNKRTVTITSGAGSPVKQIRILEISVDDVLERLNL